VPEEVADKYFVKVRMRAGPFKFDEDYRSEIEKKALRLP